MAEQQLSPLDAAITKMLADRVRARRESLASMSRTTGIPTSHLARLARLAGIRYKHQHASRPQIRAAIRAVTHQGLTFRDAALEHGMSKTAVHRFVQKRRNRSVDAVGPIKFRAKTEICPRHGRVTFWPCVICTALGLPESHP